MWGRLTAWKYEHEPSLYNGHLMLLIILIINPYLVVNNCMNNNPTPFVDIYSESGRGIYMHLLSRCCLSTYNHKMPS